MNKEHKRIVEASAKLMAVYPSMNKHQQSAVLAMMSALEQTGDK